MKEGAGTALVCAAVCDICLTSEAHTLAPTLVRTQHLMHLLTTITLS